MASDEEQRPTLPDGENTGPNPPNHPRNNDINNNFILSSGQNSRLLACLRCQQRKVKCDRKQPCSTCAKARVECTPVPILQPRRRKKRFSEAELLARLRRYETLLKTYGANIDAINDENGRTLSKERAGIGIGVDDQVWADRKAGVIPPENNVWTSVKNEFRDTEEVLEGSSDDELVQAPITTTWESMSSNNTAVLLFGAMHTHTNLAAYHPHPMDIMRLWQIFLDNVNPLKKVIHAPTTQQQILEMSMNLENVPKDMEALLFSIYVLAITSIDDARCRDTFGVERSDLLEKYQFGAQQSLLNADLLNPSSLAVLQALVIYLLSLRDGVDPRSVSCLGGLTLRLAQHMGLHRDGRGQNITHFEVEMRRRVWWSIVIFNGRIAEFSGVGTAVFTHQWTTRLPSNVNDSDLYPNMREPPVDHKGLTEMSFALAQYEIADFLRGVRSTTIYDGCCHELSSSQLSLSAKDKGIDELEKRLERKYLRHCDASIPLHFITLNMTKSAICKLRHIAHHPRLLPDRGASLPRNEKDKFFALGVKLIEYNNLLQSNKITENFMWHIVVNKPMDAYVHVLHELRYRTIGELADRAWQQVLECFSSFLVIRKMNGGKKLSAIFLALANMLTKAWEARANALQQTQPFIARPDTITHMHDYIDLWRSRKGQLATDSLPPRDVTSRDLGYDMSQYIASANHNNYTNSNGSSDNLELSTLMGTLPLEGFVDWVNWDGLTHGYPLNGIELDGADPFSMA